MRLENWSIISVPKSPYDAPELWSQRLHGNVYEHPRFEKDSLITSSRITGKDGEIILTHSGSRYELGKIDQEYEKIYPDAKNRLLKSLDKA